MEPTARPLLFGLFRRTSPPVFAGSAALMVGLVLFVLRDPGHAEAVFSQVQQFIGLHFGWVYRFTVSA